MPYLVGYATPQDYGAAGNGTTDDTTAIQAAITGVSAAGGGVVYVPAGTYKLTAALSGPNLVSIIGAGPGVSILNQTSTSANGLTYNPSSLTFASIENLTIQGPGSGTGIGVLVEANSGAATVTSCSFTDVTITGFGSHGFSLQSGVGCSVSGLNVTSVGGHCYLLNGGTGNVLSGCYAGGGATTQQGYNLTNVSYTSLSGCKAFGCGGGFLTSGGSTNVLAGCGADTIVAANGQDGSGFKISGGTSHVLTGCYSNINRAAAFYVTGSAATVTLVGVQENAPGAGATSSIKVDTGSAATVIDDTVATATSLASGTTTVLSGNTLTLAGNLTANGSTDIFTGTIAGQPSASGNTVLSANVAGTDAFDRFRLLGTGAMTIGPGTATRDTQLARTATGTLQLTNPNTTHAATLSIDGVVSGLTETLSTGAAGGKVLAITNTTSAPTADNLLITSQAAGDSTLGIQVSGDTKDRFTVDSTGKMQWGPGGATATDTDFYRANAGTLTTDGSLTVGGNLDIYNAGRGLQIGEGTNAKQGTAVLTAGAVTVANTSVTATSRIYLTIQTPGGTVGSPYVFSRTAGTSFVVHSTSGTDTSTVAYLIVEPG